MPVVRTPLSTLKSVLYIALPFHHTDSGRHFEERLARFGGKQKRARGEDWEGRVGRHLEEVPGVGIPIYMCG